MLDFLRAKHSRMLVWTLLVLIVVGLAGFGIGNTGAFRSSAVATVGDTEISTDDYARAMQQEMRALTQRLGRGLTMAEARQYGIDNVVLARLVNDAALDEEARRLGVSVGDETVARQVLDVQAFKGPDGKFDRDTYARALANVGLMPAQFEAQIRHEVSRDLIASAVQAPVAAPAAAAKVLLGYLGEKRSLTWFRLGPEALTEAVPEPDDAAIQAEYDAHHDAYTTPETRHVTYAAITPDELAPAIEVPESDLKAMYEAASDRFNTPETRLMDRIGFGTEDEAKAAKARLDSGEITFDALATERGFSASQIDQGALPASRLDPGARAAVFGLAEPGIVGPVPSPLGPSIYRVNAILAGKTVPFAEAEPDLRKERALKLAADRIANETPRIDDMLAGGATLEDLAKETDLRLGTMDVTAASSEGLAADPKFHDAVMNGETGIESDPVSLASGGVASVRVESVDAPRLRPLDEVRDQVIAAWKAAEASRRLVALAQGYADEVKGGLAFDALATRLGETPETGGPVTRSGPLPGTPAAFLRDGFAADKGGAFVTADGAGVLIGAVTDVAPFDFAAEANRDAVANAENQLRGQVADDVLASYTNAVRDAAGVTLNRAQMDAALSRIP
ncbi:peptidylprolyl isomerase [Amaricoccus solimangrovi]|uniref:Parvulin-like PPIase n=1 Tax=Amaricoccus solimangrovi TaxID=2589815 RepID=A0A501WEY3_9RHOB|nr:peptidylprolyl isomerase [Amaricoccus solimangrovi]TPE47362.1 hypothetical protein FJM51_20025 [Amaricoccus solimangrovi]